MNTVTDFILDLFTLIVTEKIYSKQQQVLHYHHMDMVEHEDIYLPLSEIHVFILKKI